VRQHSKRLSRKASRSKHRLGDKQFEAQRLLNAGFTNLNVITYDQVLHKAKIIMGKT
jgi:hypothetical protein